MKNPEIIDPIQFDQIAESESEKREESLLRIRVLNVILIVCTVSLIIFVFLKRITSDHPLSIAIPIVSLIVPFAILILYGPRYSERKSIIATSILLLRMNSIGMVLLVLVMNLFFFLHRDWFISLVITLAACYVSAFLIPIMPIFGNYFSPFRGWYASEFIFKSVLIVILSMVTGILWKSLIPSTTTTFLLSHGNQNLKLLPGVTVLIPFFLGIYISNLPLSESIKTSMYDAQSLAKRFER